MLWAWFCGTWTASRSALYIVKPDTVIAWHRKGFRLFWTGKIRRGQPGRPAVPKEIRKLIRQMSRENPLWGAPRIHGELLKLGIDIGETSVGKYMVRHRNPPSQTWRTFLENHLKSTASIDFFTVPTPTVPGTVRVPGSGARPKADRAFQRHRSSDGGVDRAATSGGLPV